MHESVKPSDLMMSIINNQQQQVMNPAVDDSRNDHVKLQHEIFFENENRAMKDLMKGLMSTKNDTQK